MLRERTPLERTPLERTPLEKKCCAPEEEYCAPKELCAKGGGRSREGRTHPLTIGCIIDVHYFFRGPGWLPNPPLLMTRFLSPRVLLGAFLCTAAVLLTAGCDEEVLGPTLRGSIEGQVRTFGSNAPIAGASVTTSPATGAFVTDGDGAFALREVDSGAYNISVRRDGFQTNTLPVAVRDGEITPATIFLEKDEDADRTEEVNAEIVNWTNRAEGNDSTFVDVEYRVRNVGTADISAYEVYVRIETAGTSFFQEARGEMLPVSQADVGTFSKFIRGETAQSVAVDDVWFDSTVL